MNKMELEIIGYIGAVFIGLVLGLIGGGGSILTVPIMVYLMGFDVVTGTAYSLFVVGTSSTVGSIRNMQSKNIDFKTAIIFAIPAVISVFVMRNYIVQLIPDVLFEIGSFTVTKHIVVMCVVAVFMVLASITMIRGRKEVVIEKEEKKRYGLLAFLGLLIGVFTGLVGAGGGFLIIPVLVIMAKLDMKKAVATSLLIIAINSLIGFLGDVGTTDIDWKFLLIFSAISIVGIFIGIYLNKLIDGKKLKKGFGWFVLVMGVYIISKEFIF
jgi:uncharacterized membrane protein YfcA